MMNNTSNYCCGPIYEKVGSTKLDVSEPNFELDTSTFVDSTFSYI